MKESDTPSNSSSAKGKGSAKQRADSLAPDDCVRREHERFSVDLQVSVLSEHNFYAGLAENISAGGLFIATHQLQKVGSRIELSLRMPESEEVFQIVGEVRWVRLYNEHSDTSPGLGVRFTELPPGAAAAIGRFLGQREPLFFDDE
ncbi:MAG: TIGR02266 family protein [Pseudomonadota bacterium]